MRFTVGVITLVGAMALGASGVAPGPFGARSALHAQGSSSNVWDGVYTEEQSKRGKGQFNDQCAGCHGTEMNGGEMAPPLAGSAFTSNWDGETVGSLEERIRITMPQGKEGTLSRQQVVDIISAVLFANDVPAGTTELPKELELLKAIKITAKKP